MGLWLTFLSSYTSTFEVFYSERVLLSQSEKNGFFFHQFLSYVSGWHWLAKLYRCQVYSCTIRRRCVVVCAPPRVRSVSSSMLRRFVQDARIGQPPTRSERHAKRGARELEMHLPPEEQLHGWKNGQLNSEGKCQPWLAVEWKQSVSQPSVLST